MKLRSVRSNIFLLFVITMVVCGLAVFAGVGSLMKSLDSQTEDTMSASLERLQHIRRVGDNVWGSMFGRDLYFLAHSRVMEGFVADIAGMDIPPKTLRALCGTQQERDSVLSGFAAGKSSADMEKLRDFGALSASVRRDLQDALQRFNYKSLFVLTQNGEAYMGTTDEPRQFSVRDTEAIKKCLGSGRMQSLPAYRVADRLMLDVAVPLTSAAVASDSQKAGSNEPKPLSGGVKADTPAGGTAQSSAAGGAAAPAAGQEGSSSPAATGESGQSGTSASPTGTPCCGVLLVTIDLRDLLERVQAGIGRDDGYNRLVEQKDDGSLVVLSYTDSTGRLPLRDWKADGDLIYFALRSLPDRPGTAYTSGQRLESMNLFSVTGVDQASAGTAGLWQRMAAAGVAMAGLCLVFFCWILFFRHRERRILYRESLESERQNQRRQIVQYVDSETGIGVVCTDFDSHILYSNDVFARIAAKEGKNLAGQMLNNLPQDIAVSIAQHSAAVWESGKAATFEDRLSAGGAWRNFKVWTCPYVDRDKYLAGVISLYQDVTESLQSERRTKDLVEQTVVSVHRLITACDPYLGRLSLSIAELGTLISRLGGQEEPEVLHLLSVAGRLCKVGVLEVLFEAFAAGKKIEDISGENLQHHVRIAGAVLGSVDFGGLAVTQCLAEMNERLDGSGYPRHLKAEDISWPARCLAIADELCSALKPRTGVGRGIDEVFSGTLATEPARFDPELVEKLHQYLRTTQGQKILQRLLAG